MPKQCCRRCCSWAPGLQGLIQGLWPGCALAVHVAPICQERPPLRLRIGTAAQTIGSVACSLAAAWWAVCGSAAVAGYLAAWCAGCVGVTLAGPLACRGVGCSNACRISRYKYKALRRPGACWLNFMQMPPARVGHPAELKALRHLRAVQSQLASTRLLLYRSKRVLANYQEPARAMQRQLS